MPRQLRTWRQPGASQNKSRLLARSSRPVNFRLFAKRCAQLNERNARVAKLRAAMHTFDDQFDFVDRLRVVPHADEVRSLESLIGNALRERMLIVQHDFECRDAIVFQPRFLVIGTRNIQAGSGCHRVEADVSR